MKEELAEQLVRNAQKEGADDVIVSVGEEKTTHLKFSMSKVVTTQTWDLLHLELFVAVGKRLVATTLKDFSADAADKVVKDVMRFVRTVKPDKDYSGIAEGPFHYSQIPETYDKTVAEGEQDVDLLERGIVTAESCGAKYCDGVLESSETGRYLLSSNNAEAEEKGTALYLSFRAIIDAYATGHAVANARMLKKFGVEKAATHAADIAMQARNPKPGKSGTYDVLFEPLPFSNLLAHVGEAASMFNVESGLSFLANKRGTQVANESVTLSDDATLAGGTHSTQFDDEGVPTAPTTIIENGILKNYLHNTSTARKCKTETTANAGVIMPRAFNLVLEKGNLNKEELLAHIKKGLLITNLWYTRFQNYETGNFSTIPRDGIFLVENGKISHPVKELRVSENLLAMMKNVSGIGNDAEHVKGWETELPVLAPPVLVRDVHITKSVE